MGGDFDNRVMSDRRGPPGEARGEGAPAPDERGGTPPPRARGLGLPGRILHGNWVVTLMIAGAIISVVVGMCGR